MAPRLALVTADELEVGELDGDALGPADGDALDVVAEPADEAVFEG